MTEKNFTPDYTHLEAEALNNPIYTYGRLWQEADEKVQNIKDYLDSLYTRTVPANWSDVADMKRLNEHLDMALQITGLAPKI